MRKALTSVAAFVLLTNVAGCGDTPEVLVHDLLVFWNEIADNQLRATDNDTAKQLMETNFKALKARHSSIKERMEKRFLTLEKDKELKKDLQFALCDYYEEARATAQRLHSVRKRMDVIIAAISNENDKKYLIEVRDFPLGLLLKVSPFPDAKNQGDPGGVPGGPGDGAKGGNNPIVTGKEGNQVGGNAPMWGAGLLPELPLPKPKQPDPPPPQGRLFLDPAIGPAPGWAVLELRRQGLA
jgi:hypothetical protein